MDWYWRDTGGQWKMFVAQCTWFSFSVFSSGSTRAKLKFKAMTRVLLNVSEEDCGLQLYCHIIPKVIVTDKKGIPHVQVYTINISAVLSGQSIAITSQIAGKYFSARRFNLSKIYYYALLHAPLVLHGEVINSFFVVE